MGLLGREVFEVMARHGIGREGRRRPTDVLEELGAARQVDPGEEATDTDRGTPNEGELCRCGHYEGGHGDAPPHPCGGHVGDETCTCLGFRPSRREA
jgi:hypothetical protein